MEIYERLRAIREDLDITQEQIAKEINCSRKQITRWETNQSEMGIYKLKELCLKYNVSADYILGLPNNLNWPRREKSNK